MKNALFYSKKLPSPVTAPRSNSIHQLNDGRTLNNGVEEEKCLEIIKIHQQKQKPKEWPLQNQTNTFYDSLEYQIRHINLAVDDNDFLARNLKKNGLDISTPFKFTTPTPTQN